MLEALARMERALARIEALGKGNNAAPAASVELEQLRAAHFVLRGRVETAIGEIDRMLDGSGSPG